MCEPYELWDLYDRDGNRTGETIARRPGFYQEVPEGRYHLVVDILVRHADGTFLVTRRSEEKPLYPGYWEASAGGSALKGEEPKEAALRELFEETGLTPDTLELVSTSTKDKSQCIYFSYLATVHGDKSAVVLQEGETTDFAWVEKNELLRLINDEQLLLPHNLRFLNYLRSLP